MNQTNDEIDASLFFLEQLARDHHNDGAPETALHINRAADILRALRVQREETIKVLANPNMVLVNMMRGGIAKPDFRAFLSMYGEVFNDLEAANIDNIELRNQHVADAKMLNWLDAQRSDLVDDHYGEPMLIGHSWSVDGQCETVRQAITEAMSAKEG